MKMDDIELSFDKNALKLMAKIAYKRKIGARALRSISEGLMLDHMYEAPTRKDKKILIDKPFLEAYVHENLPQHLVTQLVEEGSIGKK